MDLLQHEVVEASLLGRFEIPGDVAGGGSHFDTVEGRHPEEPGAELDDVVVLDHVDLTRLAEDGRDVGGQ